MNAAIYSRVSTDEQRRYGISLEAQVAKSQQYAAALGLTVSHVGIDAQSAKDADRPELQKILNMASKKLIQHIIVMKLDRLSRDVEDSARIGKMLTKKGVSLHLVSEGGIVDLADPSQEMLFHMRSSMARFERKRISLNTKFALERKREKSEKISRFAPYGYQFDGNKVVENPAEQSIIGRIHTLSRTGLSIRKIISKLESEGIFSRSGSLFSVKTVHSILNSKTDINTLKAA